LGKEELFSAEKRNYSFVQTSLQTRKIKEAVGVLSAAFQLYGGLEVRWYGDVK